MGLQSELSVFLGCSLQVPENFKLAHYSYSSDNGGLEHYQSIGKSFLTLISTHLAISSGITDDKKWDSYGQAVKKYLMGYYSQKLIASHIYSEISFGPGVTELEKTSFAIARMMFEIILGQLISDGNLYSIYHKFSDLRDRVTIDSTNVNYKTLLNELLQKLGKNLPKYETISTEGPQHDLNFSIKIDAGNNIVIGKGSSKKAAQKDAARKAYLKLKPDYKEPSFTLRGLSFSFTRENIKKHKITFDENVYKKLGIPKSVEIIPALIHPRMKSLGYWKGQSQRSLSMLGAHLLDLTVSLHAYQQFISGKLNGYNKASLARQVLANSKLAEIYTLGFLNVGKLPFHHEELSLIPYKVDCIQALSFLSFLHYMEIEHFQGFLETEFIKWVYKRADFISSREVESLKDNPSSIAVERLQGLGILYEYTKIDEQLGVKLSFVNQNIDFIFNPENTLETFKERKKRLATCLLYAMDVSESVGLAGNEPKNSKALYQDLSNFFDSGMIASRKEFAEVNNIIVPEIEVANMTNYSASNYEQLVAEWNKSSSLEIHEKVELLARIRVYLGVNNNLSETIEFAYLPIIFDEQYDYGKSNSIIEFDEYSEVPLDDGIEEILSNSQNTKTTNSQTRKQRFDKQENIQKASSSNVGEQSYPQIEVLLGNIKSKSVASLEYLWKNRFELFESEEEAAITLAQLRYERGVDFTLQGYKTFLNTELIKELELPSLLIYRIGANPVQKIKKIKGGYFSSTAQKNKQEFKLKKTDERQFSVRKVALRKGQSNFRQMLLRERNYCCITNCQVSSVLEAAHIAPYRGEKDNHIQNGLILRSDIHKLFDSYLIGINPDTFQIEVSEELLGSEYGTLQGKKIDGLNNLSKKALYYRWGYYQERNYK